MWIQWVHSYYIKDRNIKNMATPKQASWVIKKILDAREWFMQNCPNDTLSSYCKGGKFYIKKLYKAARPQYQKCNWKRLVTTSKAIPRHQFILWLALHRKWATVERLQKWGITVNKDCVLCSSNTKYTFEHLLFECTYSRNMWNAMLK